MMLWCRRADDQVVVRDSRVRSASKCIRHSETFSTRRVLRDLRLSIPTLHPDYQALMVDVC
jgi:hypothetical protein